MARVYTAHNYIARDFILTEIKPILEAKGHSITSRWLTENFPNTLESAVMDLEDIEKSDALILFIDQFGPTPGRGKYLELGYAIRAGKKCILVGEHFESCVFYKLPSLRYTKTIEGALSFL